LSVRSRLSSHRAESAPTLFHTGLGSVDPIALRLETTQRPGADDSYERSSKFLAALLHERHHWLQHVGTGAGMFGSLLLELQGTIIGEVALAHRLTAADLPLQANEERFAEPLLLWERLEATRRLFFGCRTRDLTDLERDGRTPLWRALGPQLHGLMAGVYGDLPEIDGLLDFLLHGREELSPNTAAITEAGWILGARHLMEGAARTSEVVRLAIGLADQHYDENWDGTPFRFNVDRHFTGVYGLARKLFHDMVGQAAAAAEVGFAFACDVALNCLAPPVFPFPPESPGIVFLRVCKALADFRFDRAVNMRDPAEIRALLGELTEHIGANPDIDLDYWTTMAGRKFAALDIDETAAAMYTFDGHDLPDPRGNGARLRYTTALSVQAIGLRAQESALFVFPAALYLDDRKRFRDLFDRIPPPLVAYGDSGLWPTREQRGWLDFFLASGVQNEIFRGMVMSNAQELGTRLVPFLRSGGGAEHGRQVLRRAIGSTLGDSPLANDIWQHTVNAADSG
jgi:hypothetical protein